MCIRFIKYGFSKYSIALLDMEMAHEAIVNGADECIFITEHDALYSAGKSFEPKDFVEIPDAPIYYPNRGGRVTVHAPGQLVVYPIINLRKHKINISKYVCILENLIISILKKFNICGIITDKGKGVWVDNCKIGFIGIGVKSGVTSHGFCINISNDLNMFNKIIPCGIDEVKITSISEILGCQVNMDCVIQHLLECLPNAKIQIES
ncbi:MAG: lipoyl(octanoyl) transferase LipB [Holosporales bacterium]|jgi:lipoyl(octanoyl) transferase|nr:lipoyl(octanoyl) transferase LipB [Holosporales bacterium]